MRIIFISGLFLVTSLMTYPQKDTRYYYTYKGRVTFNNAVNNDSITIKLPNALHLTNPKFKSKDPYYYKLHYHEIKLQAEGTFFKKDTIIYPPLNNPSLYLHHLFIDNPMDYKIIISNGKIDNVILIDITKIRFIIKEYEITIEFPEIFIN